MANNKTLAIILAAGKGTRMNMGIPKPLVKVKKRPIISWLIDDFRKNRGRQKPDSSRKIYP